MQKYKSMASVSSWVASLRPRTLFLAVASTICGNAMAYSVGQLNTTVCILTLSVAILLQLISNMANDLGDFQHGTDITGERVGPTRTVQSGAIMSSEMKIGITIAVIISLFVGGFLVFNALQYIEFRYVTLFLALGAFSIWAAIRYTAGNNPYGYKGLGDIYSFFFFGPVAVVGTFFLNVYEITFQPWLPSFSIGLFTAAVLNINNMRDRDNDLKSGKITLAIKLGIKRSKVYHTFLVLGGIFCFLLYAITYSQNSFQYLFLFFALPLLWILIKIWRTKESKMLDPYLKQTSIATFVLSLAFAFFTNVI